MEAPKHSHSNSERWEHSRDFFTQLLALQSNDREALLKKIGQTDVALRSELEQLLAADQADKRNSITGIVSNVVNDADRHCRQQLIGSTIGSYRIISILGIGGAGTVYLAERIDEQYEAQVAIKVVSDTSASAHLLQRFRVERQVLARLNHPYIARLIDAGETEQGSAYLVMEYVQGERIDRYCDDRKLSVAARLQVVAKVCEAVRFAHQHLIIHRDLKPANILVTAEGTPKLLDFGVAKLLDPEDELASLALTQHNDRPITPEYASPEQILGRETSTSTDIYALGVVLYELLTGTRPYALYSSNQMQLQTAICSTDPVRPSRTLADDLVATGVAATRSVTPTKLRRALAGDIDAIVLRALRKEPDRRYGSVEQLASDIQRHLSGDPVAARRGNKLYYTSRYLRKHAFIASVGAMATVSLIVFAIHTWIQAKHIAAERDRAELVSSFMLDVFGAADPFVSEGKQVTARELLDKAAARIDSELKDQPEARAQLMEAIGTAYSSQGQSQRAIPYLQQALLSYRATNVSALQLARALRQLGRAELELGHFVEATASFREGAALLEQTHNEHSLEYINMLRGFAMLEHNQGHIYTSTSYYRRILNLSREVMGPNSSTTAEILVEMASPISWQENLTTSEKLLREALDIYGKINKSGPARLATEAELGSILMREGKLAQAEPLLEHSVQELRTVFGRSSSKTEVPLLYLSELRRIQHRYAEAEAAIREALSATQDASGNRSVIAGYELTYLTNVYLEQGRTVEAEKTARDALDILLSSLVPDHQFIAAAEYQLGLVLLAENQFGESTQLLESSITRWQHASAPRWRAARSRSALGEVLFKRGQTEAGKRNLLQGYETLAQDLGTEHEETRIAKSRLERLLGSHATPKLARVIDTHAGN